MKKPSRLKNIAFSTPHPFETSMKFGHEKTVTKGKNRSSIDKISHNQINAKKGKKLRDPVILGQLTRASY